MHNVYSEYCLWHWSKQSIWIKNQYTFYFFSCRLNEHTWHVPLHYFYVNCDSYGESSSWWLEGRNAKVRCSCITEKRSLIKFVDFSFQEGKKMKRFIPSSICFLDLSHCFKEQCWLMLWQNQDKMSPSFCWKGRRDSWIAFAKFLLHKEE